MQELLTGKIGILMGIRSVDLVFIRFSRNLKQFLVINIREHKKVNQKNYFCKKNT